MSLVHIKPSWSPRVRHAARKYRRDLRRCQRRFERALAKGATQGEAATMMCLDEARAVLDMLKRLGYGSDRPKIPARDRLELELMVHERDESASLNFFRLFMAQQKERPLEQAFSRKGRERSREQVDGMRQQHIEELRTALNVRNLAYQWLAQYFSRMELRKKYGEFTRVQFDRSVDDEAKAAYMALLFQQIANRSDRSTEEVLEEFNRMVEALGVDATTAEIQLPDDPAGDGD